MHGENKGDDSIYSDACEARDRDGDEISGQMVERTDATPADPRSGAKAVAFINAPLHS